MAPPAPISNALNPPPVQKPPDPVLAASGHEDLLGDPGTGFMARTGERIKDNVLALPRLAKQALEPSSAQTSNKLNTTQSAVESMRSPLGQYKDPANIAGDMISMGLPLEMGGMPERQPLVGEHPAFHQQLMSSTEQHGAATMNPRTGMPVTGNKFAVSIAPEHSVYSETPFSHEQVSSFVQQHQDVLQRNPNLHVSTMKDPHGVYSLELSATTSNKPAAVQMGQELNQQGVYHVGRGEHVPTGGTGEAAPHQLSVDERAQMLHAASPQTWEAQPFSGTHYSDQKLDYIDGNRRGIKPNGKNGQPTPPTGQEAARLNLQSQTGVGQDAPPGYYVYKNGSRPEPGVGTRPFSHSVRDNFAIAKIGDPQWEQAAQQAHDEVLQQTGNPQAAQYAKANAKEHAIRDAGYDGYTSSGNHGVHFLFDGHETSLVGSPPKPFELPASRQPAQVTNNASGQTMASQEALNRQASEKALGERRVAVDTRSGTERPLIGPEAVDYRAQPHESVEFRGGQREGEVINAGNKARPYKKAVSSGAEKAPNTAFFKRALAERPNEPLKNQIEYSQQLRQKAEKAPGGDPAEINRIASEYLKSLGAK